MPVFSLPPEHVFPDPNLARPDGLLAWGGDLDPRRLLTAYATGIFPWYSEDQPILWFSPDPRFVLFVDELHLGRSLRKTLKKGRYRLTMDTAFRQVMEACGQVPRRGQRGTWITQDMLTGYTQLHEAGFAHSVEAWDESGRLVGGCYGVCLGRIFFGESMFAIAPDASKIAFVALLDQLAAWGVDLVDSQVYTDHLARFGAREIPRTRYLELLDERIQQPTVRGAWSFDDGRLAQLQENGRPAFQIEGAQGSKS